MLMCDMKEGQSGVISDIRLAPAFVERLRDMGFCEGERTECVKYACAGSPILFRIKGSAVAVRKSDASGIEVSV